MKRITLIMLAIGLVQIARAGVTTHLALDCRTGVRTCLADGEVLRYDAGWCENGDEVRITDNGTVVATGTVGSFAWRPASDCSAPHLLKLEVLSSDGQVVGTEAAQFGLGYIRNIKARQLWPHNKVAIEFTVAADIGEVSGENEDLSVWLRQGGAIKVATQILGDRSAKPGIHRIAWDLEAEGLRFVDPETTFGVCRVEEIPWGGVQLWENGPYWAECNVGASKPEEYGCYFWWGDTVGYKRNAANNGWVSVGGGTLSSFSSNNCSTYGKDNSQLQLEGYIDSSGNLVAKHDAATAHLGAPWRMPTITEVDALLGNCDMTIATRNGVVGWLVTGKGALASKSIFLPQAGSARYGNKSDYNQYFSATPSNSDCAWGFTPVSRFDSIPRFDGCPVRSLRVAGQLCAVNVAATAVDTTIDDGLAVSGSVNLGYSPVDAGTVTLEVDGSEVLRTAEEGSYDWSPEQAGTHLCVHRTGGAVFTRKVVCPPPETAKELVIGWLDGPIANLFPDIYVAVTNVLISPSVTELPEEAFAGCAALTAVTIPECVKRIGVNVFIGCTALSRLNLPSGLVDFGLDSIPEHLRASMYDENGFLILNGWLLDYKDKTASSLVVPEGVVGIGRSALAEMYDLETVDLPSTLKYIAEKAFELDTYLDNVEIPDSVQTIGDGAFCDCSYLQTISFGAGLKSVGEEAFKGCTQLQRAVFADGLTTIGVDAFKGDWRMQSASLPTSVVSLSSSAFTGCSSLTGVTVPTMRGTMAEWFAPVKAQIREVTVPAGTTEVVSNMFVNCSGLQKVVLPESVTNIGDFAFANCSLLNEVTIRGEGLVSIGASAFKECSSLKDLVLPESVAILADEVFYGCTSLSAFVLPENVSEIGEGVFRDCSSLADVTLSRGLVELPAYTFYGCSRLGSFYVPAAVTNVGAYVCSSATRSIYYLGNAPSCEANVFASAYSVVNYVILGTKGWDGRPQSRDIPQSWQGRSILTWSANKFDVTYDAGEGVFIPVETNEYACEQITYTGYKLPPYNPKRAGYWFDGWWTEQEGGTEIRTTTKVVLTKPHLLYAHWKPVPEDQLITVRFNAAGGDVAPDTQKYTAGEPYCELPIPTREHFTFIGWYTESFGGVRQMVNSSAPKADRELFAHWTPNVYIIRFHSNNGEDETVDQRYVYGTSVTLRSNGFVQNNAAFDGWAAEPDGEVVYEDRATMANVGAVQNGIIHLYAVWKKVVLNYAVRFDSHGGEGMMPNQTFEIGVQQNLSLCLFTRAGFVFGGWALSADGDAVYGDGETVADLTTVQNATIVLYAVWERDPTQEWTVEEYLNCTNLTFTLGGDSPYWQGLKVSRADKSGMMRSGAIGDSQTNWIETVVSGPGTVSFWWKASGEYEVSKKGIVTMYDFAEFTIDGVSVAEIGAESSWTEVTQTIEGVGVHTLRWMYHKDESGSDGEDCAWLSEVVWVPSGVAIPDLGDTPSAADVTNAVAGAKDPQVTAKVDKTNYNDFRDWAGKVKTTGGGDAGVQGVMAADNAWISYALGQGTLLDAAPTDEDLSVETFEPAAESGKFDFTVSIKDVEVGSDAAKENLKKVFGLEGAATLDGAAFSSDKVEVEFGTPVDGKVKFTAGPKDASAGTFFMKVKMLP